MAKGTLILGLGNTLLGDEGAGVHVVRALRARLPDGAEVECLDGGTLSFTLAVPIENATRLIVIDATELVAAPGTIQVFVGEAMDRFLGSNRRRSVHEVALLDLMAIACLSEHLPTRRALIGIQPEIVTWSDSPSPRVAAAIGGACAAALELIAEWNA